MSRKQILALAGQIPPGCSTLFAGTEPSKTWFKGWRDRMAEIEPNLTIVLERGAEERSIKWFNSSNVNCWFKKFAELAKKHKFGEKQDYNSEFTWLCPERVIITDETSFSSGT